MKVKRLKGEGVSPVIRVSDSTYEKLRALAIPFEDTPATVIDRLLSKYGEARGEQELHPDESERVQEETLHLNPDSPDSLTHTRVLKAVFDGMEIEKPKWNTLVRIGHEIALQRSGSYETFQKITTANVVKGKREEDGFTYLSEANISVQGLSADSAWESILKLARNLQVPTSVELEWRNNHKADHPGKRGILEWAPKS